MKRKIFELLHRKEPKMALRVGQFAPDFSLETHLGEKLRLSDFRGKKNVALIFFPLAFTPV
jgi:peroxiredoxin